MNTPETAGAGTGKLLEIGWRRFFAPDGYPYSLAMVAARDSSSELVELLLSELPLGHRVLDLGCGTGSLASRLADRGLCVVGVDAFVHRDSTSGSSASLVVGAFEELPFADASFDAVISTYTSIGFDPELVSLQLREIARVTHGRGVLILDLLNDRLGFRQTLDRYPRGSALAWQLTTRRRVTYVSFARVDRRWRIFFWVRMRWTPCVVSEFLRGVSYEVVTTRGQHDGGEWRARSPRLFISAVRVA